MKDFFISYNKADRTWAEWIAWQLEEAGYSVVIQAWDFRPGSNFVLDMQRGLVEAERVVAVLSPDFLESLYTQPEWAAAFAADPTGERKTLLPVRVRECKLTGLLSQTTYINLVELNETAAKETLLAGVVRDRAKPLTAPGFPGTTQHTINAKPDFLWLQYLSALEHKVSKVSLFGGTESRALDQVFVELSINEDYDRRPNQAEFLGLMDSELRRMRSVFGDAEQNRDDPNDPTQSHLTKAKRTIKPDELLRHHTHAVITGAPGCGKTTLLRYLAWQTLKQWRDAADGGSTGSVSDLSLGTANYFPVFLELKQLTSADFQQASLEDLLFRKAIAATIKPRDEAERDSLQQHFRTLLEQDRVAIFLDGLDEVSGAKFFGDLQSAVSDFLQSAYGNNTVIISTRPFALRQFGDAKMMEIQPLNPRQIEQFIGHYYHDVPERQQFQRELQRRRELRELARVPALLGFILQLWRKRGTVTDDKLELYAQITLELAQQLDREKEGIAPEREWLVEDKDGSLKLDLLRQLAFHQLFKGLIHPPYEVGGTTNDVDRLVFTSEQLRAEAAAFARTLKEREGLTIHPRNLAEDVKATALLRQVGADHYAFAHLTLQEYLAAWQLAKRHDAATCERIFCRAYFNPTLAEMEVLPMTLGLVDEPDKLYEALEQLPESLDFKGLRIRARGLAHIQKAGRGYLMNMSDHLIEFATNCSDENTPFRGAVLGSFRPKSEHLDVISARLISYLESEDQSVKDEVTYMLGQLGAESAVDALIGLLQIEDKKSFGAASHALGQIGGKRVVDLMIDSLRNKRADWHWKASYILGYIGGERAVAALLEALKDEDKDGRWRAVGALEETGYETVLHPLIEMLSDEDSGVRERVIEVLGRIGGETAATALITALSDQEISVRSKAIYSLGKIKDELATRMLVELLRDKDFWARDSVARALWGNGATEVITALIEAMKDDDENLRYMAASALEVIGGEQTATALIEALEDENVLVRWRAAYGLDRNGGERALEALTKLLDDKDKYVRVAVAYSLGRRGIKTGIDVLLEALNSEVDGIHNDEDESLRKRVVYCLGRLGGEPALVALTQVIRAENSNLREAAVFALGLIGEEKAVGALAGMLKDADDGVRETAAKALASLGDRKLFNGLKLSLLDEAVFVRRKATTVIGYYADDDQIWQGLFTLNTIDSSEEVRQAARESLKNWTLAKIWYFSAPQSTLLSNFR